MIKFNNDTVVDTKTGIKANVCYNIMITFGTKKAINIHPRDDSGNLKKIFPNEYIASDYYGYVKIFEDHPLYKSLYKKAEEVEKSFIKKVKAKYKFNL
jgi:hypothetical protein